MLGKMHVVFYSFILEMVQTFSPSFSLDIRKHILEALSTLEKGVEEQLKRLPVLSFISGDLR